MTMHYYQDKIIYIFGGSSGIGLATACELARLGAKIHIFARRVDVLQSAREDILKYAPKADSVAYSSVDVTDDESVKTAFSTAASTTGKPDIVLNCAGAAFPNYFENIGADQFERTLKLNVLGVRNIAAAAVPYLKENAGHLINTSSIAGFIGVFGYTDYCASKFAIVGFSEALQAEVKQHGISVSVLYPPDTYTAGFEEEEKTKPEETRAISGNNKPMTAEQVAAAVVKSLPSRKFNIIPGIDSRLSYLLKRWFPWLVTMVMDNAIRKVQKR